MTEQKLPSGIVTFLFTDIQGSTSLWQEHPQAMPVALARHHALLRQAIEAHHGYVFQIIGDAFCAAFQTAQDGLQAAIEAQHFLCGEAWGETGPIQVRMALHSGPVEVQAGEYTSGEYRSGLTLSRAARLLSAGHGGQVLMSKPTFELVMDHLPAGIELRDLGPHRLKDLIHPEHIYQVTGPGLRAEFPVLKSLNARPHNLPAQLTSFIGRQEAIAAIQAALNRARLLTLTGPGGAGKTRLALQAAADVIDDFPDGAWFVDLAPLSDSQLVPGAVAGMWELLEQPWRPLNQALADFLRGKKILIILDNCEHLREACARLSLELLQASPALKIMATSRELLGIPGEVHYSVPTLSTPTAGGLDRLENVAQFESVHLFVERALAVRPDFSLTSANASTVAQICQQLDGIPLAIELAAARLRALSVEQIADRLRDRFRLLTGGNRAGLPRQQTLRALVDWSYNLLTEDERRLFCRLAVFQGGWQLEAAETACGGDGVDPLDILDLLTRLVDQSLVIVDELDTQPRYRFLEILRQYAAEILRATGEWEYWRGRHMAYCLALAEEAEPRLRSAQDIVWLDLIEKDHDNLRAALDTAAQHNNPESALRLCAALWYFWYRRGHIQEGLKHLQNALKMPGAPGVPLAFTNALVSLGIYLWITGNYPSALDTLNQSIGLARDLGDQGRTSLAKALAYLGFSQMRMGDFPAARWAASESLALSREIQDTYTQSVSNYGLGRIQIEQGDVESARVYLEDAFDLVQQAGDHLLTSLILNSLVLLAMAKQDYAEALSLNQRSLENARQSGDVWMISGALREAGNTAQALGDYAGARAFFKESGELSRRQGLLNDLARICFNLGYIDILQGDLLTARASLQESQALFQQTGYLRGQAEVLDGWAAYFVGLSQYELAARLIGSTDAALQSLQAPRWPVDMQEYHKLSATVAARLGAEAFDKAYSDGGKLNLEQAQEEVRQILPE